MSDMRTDSAIRLNMIVSSWSSWTTVLALMSYPIAESGIKEKKNTKQNNK